MALAMAGLLPLMFFMLTLVEASRVYGVKNQLQATADAAAMASVWDVPNGLGPVRQKAIGYAEYNMPFAEQYGEAAVLVDADVEMGTWVADRVEPGPFDPAGAPPDAVQVTTRGEMRLFFAGALRSLGVEAPDTFTPSAQATALLRPDKCYLNGFVAGGIVQMNSQNTFGVGFCVYGRNGVTMNNSNEFAPDTEVGMVDLGTLVEGGNNPGLHDARVEKNVAPPAPDAAKQMIHDLRLNSVEIPSWPPPTIESGKRYYVDGDVVIDQNDVTDGDTLDNVGIISGTSITVESGSFLRNVTLGSSGPVNIDSNVEFGDADFCTTGLGQSLILSGSDLTGNPATETNSNIRFYGVQMITDGPIEMNSNLKIVGASIQSSGNIVFNSRFDVAGCPDESPNVTGGGTMVSQLVD